MTRQRALLVGLVVAVTQSLGLSCYLAHERCPDAEVVPPGLPRAGFVGVGVFPPPGQSELGANFYPVTWAVASRTGIASECRVVFEEPPCIAVVCMATAAISPDDAGDIGASVDEVAVGTLVRRDAAGTAGDYRLALTDPPSPGQTVHFRASGGADVPAFEGCVPLPSPPDAVLPSTITAGAPLALSWRPGPADQMIVAADGSGPSVRCTVPAGAGSVTIPASITALFVAGRVDLSLTARNARVIAAGSYEVHVVGDQGLAALVRVE